MFRVLLADHQGVLRAGMRALLNTESDIEIVGEAADGETALHLVELTRPNLVVTELSLPDMNGIELIRCLRGTFPKVRILVLTCHQHDDLVWESIHAGASGYYAKQLDGTDLSDALRCAARGEIYIHPSLIHCLWLKDLRPAVGSEECDEVTLTNRELDVLRLVAKGYTNRQMAKQLHIGVRTVETHRARLMEKLGVHSRVELVRYATSRGLHLNGGDGGNDGS